MALVSVPSAFGTVVLARQIIHLIYPPVEFAPAATILAILVGSVAVGHLNSILFTLLLATNRQKASMVASLIIAALATLANFLFVPGQGAVAVACIVAGTDLAYFTGISIYLSRTHYAFSLVDLYLKPVLASSCMAAALLALPQLPVLMLIPIGGGIYLAAILLLRGLGQQEREIFQGLFRKLT
jgi:O-antigen/teichoic acid export membrane protein